MIVTIGATYTDCGYHRTVPKTAVQKAPDAEVWRRIIVVTNQPEAKSVMVPVLARWEYLDSDGIETKWKVATERNLEVPMTSLNSRFQRHSGGERT